MSPNASNEEIRSTVPKPIALDGLTIAVAGATSYLATRFMDAAASRGARILPIIRDEGARSRLPISFAQSQHILLSNLARHQDALGEVDVLVNTATCYGRAGESHAELYSTNVALPLMLMASCVRHRVPTFVNIGSILEGNVSLYAETKAFADDLVGALATDKNRFVSIKPDIFFGPGEHNANKFPIWLIRQLMTGVPQVQLSSGTQQRFFLHVDDVVRAIIHVVQQIGNLPEAQLKFDIGAEEPTTIREFALTAKRVTGSATSLEFGAIPDRENEPLRPQLDQSLARRTGWRDLISLEEAIIDVVKHDQSLCSPLK